MGDIIHEPNSLSESQLITYINGGISIILRQVKGSELQMIMFSLGSGSRSGKGGLDDV